MANIRDVAQEAGVSVSTVSKVVNKTGSISKSTRKRVLEIADRLDYHPNAFARGLVTHEVENIAFMWDRSSESPFSNPFYSLVLEGIEEELVKKGYNLLIAAHSSYDNSSMLPSFLPSKIVGGLILAGQFNPDFIKKLEDAQIPTVLVDFYLENSRFDSIETDNSQGAALAIDYLLANGHRKIGCLVGNNEHPSVVKRFETVLKRLEAYGIKSNEIFIGYGDVTPEGGSKAIRKILDFKPQPTALIASNDAMAIGAMRFLRGKELRIPDDISIIGFDDIDLAQHADPPLTTVRVDKIKMGRIAAKRLLEILKEKDPEKCRVILSTTLIARDSVKKIKS